ncbi:MAG TPA: hypothetical protein HA261_03520 [Methanosarcina sp.]|nr:hypothetical protein [Methanosarcina sp.]
MNTKKKFGIGTLFLAIFLVSIAVVPTASADIISSSDEEISVNENITYTDAELQDLYLKYNISENDIKFAMNELPNFLEGTILCSDKRVIVTKDGNPPKNLKQDINFDIVISEQEMKNIIEEASKNYIETYNVDPNNPQVDIVNGYALPEKEVKKLVESGKLSIIDDEKTLMEFENSSVSTGTSAITFTHIYRNPYQISNKINVNIFVAKEDSNHHAPTESYYQDTVDALSRFESYGITVNRIWHYNFWDASDVTPYEQSSSLLDDLEEDATWIIENPNDIVIGWVNSMDNNGRAWRPGSFSVCAVTAIGVD